MSLTVSVRPFDYVIFGATGDLTMRKLLPGFYYRMLEGQVPEEARIIGTARSPLTREVYQERAATALKKFVKEDDYDDAKIRRFLKLIHYVSLDGSKPESDWDKLHAVISDKQTDRVRVFYFATAPNLYGAIAKNLHDKKLAIADARVVLEKPIGVDLATATEINTSVGQYFKEENIFRIDHYLGKETVQGVIALRFSNPMFEAVWSSDYIESVQITAAETVGVEGRAAYYDESGALRDMIQNHLLQVLSLIGMEKPRSMAADDVRDAKVAVLQALKPFDQTTVATHAVRGQYVAGRIKSDDVPGYLEELGKGSNTETYVALCAEIDTPRWKNVPFFIRTAKRLEEKVSEIVITFRPTETRLFPTKVQRNILAIRVQPDEGISWTFNAKNPVHDDFSLGQATMRVDFAHTFQTRYPDAYERLMLDAVRGDPILFIRRDEVEAAWTWLAPLMKAWAEKQSPMTQYKAGSWGPDEARLMLQRHNAQWHEEMNL